MFKFITHINELRFKILYAITGLFSTFITSYLLVPKIINLLSRAFFQFVKYEDYDFTFINIFEIFDIYIKLAFFISIFLHIPINIYFLFSFIKPGLFKYEKSRLSFFLKSFLFFIIISLFFAYFLIFPLIISFLLNLDLVTSSEFVKIKIQIRLYDYISFLFKFLVIYCLILLQIPLLICLMFYFNKFEFSFFYNKRKNWIIISLLISCFLSPPDLVSFFLITFFILLLFELIVLISIFKYFYKKHLLKESCLKG